jgi:chitinase
MALFPGLVRYDEASDANRTDLGHALRMTTRDTNGYVFPASHDAGNGTGAPPLGTRLRLKALVNGQDPALRTNDPMARRIFRTMQKYGLIIDDNGSDMYVSGTFDTRWNNDILNPAFSAIKASDFEVIELGYNPPPAGTPTLAIDNVSLAEGNAGTTLATFTVSLSQASDAAVTFDIATADGTATAGSDYVAKSTPGASIAAGQTSTTFSVTVSGDTTLEANETFFANVSNVSGAVVGDGQGLATITNDDGPMLSVNDPVVAEGNSGTKVMTFTVRLSAASTGPVTFNIATANGTAGAGSDYVARSLVGQSIPAGQTTRAFAVTINGDTTVEGNETLTANVAEVTGATVADGTGLGKILNDDGPTLSIADVAMAEGQSGTQLATFTVALSTAAAVPVTYNIATANGSATAGSDYVAKTLNGQSIPAGSLTKTFTVTLNGDTTVEGNETFTVTLFSPVGATLFDEQAVGTLLNDDGPTLSITDVQVVEGASGQAKAIFTVKLSQVAAVPVTYSISTANGTATSSSGDYVARSLTGETIPAGQLQRSFPVNVNGDAAVEANETFTANITTSSGASRFDAQGVATILNDDGPTLSVGDVTATEGQGGLKTFTFTASLSQAAAGPVYFDLATGDGTATAASSDYVARSLGGLSIPAGMLSKAFGVSVRGDTAVEPDETFVVNATNVSGPATLLDGQGTGTITNDD